MKISAYIPCFNNASSIRAAIESVRAQTIPIEEIFVVDDGSSDESVAIVRDMGLRVIDFGRNMGRGAVRARAMLEAANDIVLSCDATNELIPEFVERALPWFKRDNVAAAFGRIGRGTGKRPGQRWRARHMYKENLVESIRHGASLATWGVVMRRSTVLAVGNFDQALRHTEDAELGVRLLAAGYDVVFAPDLLVRSNKQENWLEVLERYRRQIIYSIKVMAREDLQARDVATVPISLIQPHYQFWMAVWKGHRNGRS